MRAFLIADTNMPGMEYSLHWVCEGWVGVGHVNFMFFCLLMVWVVYQTQMLFLLEYGVKCDIPTRLMSVATKLYSISIHTIAATKSDAHKKALNKPNSINRRT